MVITEPAVASTRLLGLGSKLYPSNMQRILKKDLTQFTESLSRVRQNQASQRKALLAGWDTGFLVLSIPCFFDQLFSISASPRSACPSPRSYIRALGVINRWMPREVDIKFIDFNCLFAVNSSPTTKAAKTWSLVIVMSLTLLNVSVRRLLITQKS